MRISRVYTDQTLVPEQGYELDGPAGHYLARVLKVRPQQPLVLFNGDGWDYAAEVMSVQRDRVAVEVHARVPSRAESSLDLCLVQAISRGERMDYSLQKSVELGVTSIDLLWTERVEVRLSRERLEKRMLHWQRVIQSACEQSGRGTVPVLRPPVSLNEWLAQESPRLRIWLSPESERSLTTLESPRAGLSLLVGPEGGLSQTETDMLQEHAVTACRLGPRILRTETAGPAAIAVLQSVFGDFA